MRSDAWAGALSWCNIQVWLATIHASSCAQHPSYELKRPGTTVCLPSDHVVQIHDVQGLSNQKNTTNITLIFGRLIRAFFFFLVEETFSPSTATIASWFQHHTHKPTSHLLLRCSSGSLHCHLHWQAVPDWFQHGSPQRALVLVGALFKKFGLYLNTPRILLSDLLIVKIRLEWPSKA